jgi:hypothetical protein
VLGFEPSVFDHLQNLFLREIKCCEELRRGAKMQSCSFYALLSILYLINHLTAAKCLINTFFYQPPKEQNVNNRVHSSAA